MKKILKEPLLHFLVIGALIFAVFFVVNNEKLTIKNEKHKKKIEKLKMKELIINF